MSSPIGCPNDPECRVFGIHCTTSRLYPDGMANDTSPFPISTPDKPPRRRRWIPLSLRLFVGLLALLGVAGAWIGWRGYQQKALIDEFRDLGGYVDLELAGPEWFREVIGSDRMEMFDRVVVVAAGNCPFTDDTVRRISRWTTLKVLLVRGPKVTDEGLKSLKGLSNLEKLDLSFTSVTDAGLGEFAQLKNLTVLTLSGPEISDAGLRQMTSLTGLKSLRLYQTKVTPTGVAELERALPQLRVSILVGSKVYSVDGPVFPAGNELKSR